MRVYVRYDPEFIATVLADADRSTVREASEQHGVSTKSVSDWRRHRATLGDWPNQQDVIDFRAQAERRALARRRDKASRIRRHRNGGKPLTRNGVGIMRRMQALYALGWTWDSLAREAGKTKDIVSRIAYGNHCLERGVYPHTAAWVIELYDRLCMTRPEGWVADRARNNGKRNGWHPPLAWSNIDDPNERPNYGGPVDREHVDEIVVERVLLGDRVPLATKAERREVYRRWQGSLAELERQTGWNTDRDRDLRRELADAA